MHTKGRHRALDVIDQGLRAVGLNDAPPWFDDFPIESQRWLHRLANAMAGCDEMLAFRHAPCGGYKARPIACHSRVDPSCEHDRVVDLGRRILAVLDTVPRRRRSFAVLTARNARRLADGYRALSAGWDRLKARPLFRGGRCRQRTRDGQPFHPCAAATCSRWRCRHNDERACPRCRHRADRNCRDFKHERVPGGVAIEEVTHHKCRAYVLDRATKLWGIRACEADCEWRGSWHPHLNLLMEAPFIPQAELADAWRSSTCGDRVHRRAGWCPRGCEDGSSIVWIEAVDPSTVFEAVKYVTKPADLVDDADPWPMIEFLLASHGRRLVRGWGSFFNVAFEADPDDERPKVKLIGEEIAHDRDGRSIRRVYMLDRFPECCGQDSLLPGGAVAWDLPIIVPRDEVTFEKGGRTWRPRPRPHPRR